MFENRLRLCTKRGSGIMRGSFAEFGKIIKSRLVFFMVLILLCANFFCLYDLLRSECYTPTEYSVLWQDILQQKEGERLDYSRALLNDLQQNLIDSGVFYTKELILYQEVVSELEAENGYRNYVKNLEKQKELITNSVLFHGKDSYSTKSAEKAYQDYRRAKEPVITEAPSKGFSLISLTVTDLLASCAAVFACVVLFVREREQGMVRLQWTFRKGRLQHLGYKITALFLCSCMLTMLFYGGNYIVAACSYGIGPLNREIRMVAEYANSIHNFSVGTWLLLNLLLKMVVLFVVMLLASICSILLNGVIRVVLCFTGILLVEFMLYSGISATSVYSPFRFINLFALFHNDEWLLHYKHINLFGQPVEYSVCLAGAILLIMLLASIGCIIGYQSYGKRIEHYDVMRRTVMGKKQRICANMICLELWKSLILQRLLLMLVGLFALQTLYYLSTEIPGISAEEYYYKAFMTRLEGGITENTEATLAEILEQAKRAANNSALSAYTRVEERYHYLQKHGGCFVYDTGFKILCGNKEKDKELILALKNLLVILLFTASVFCYDSQRRMDGLLHSTVKGEKKVAFCKYIICSIVGMLVCVAVYLPDYLQIARFYGVRGLTYPACSLPWLADYGLNVSIGEYLWLLYSYRLLMCPICVIFFMVAAERIKSFIYTFFVCGIYVLCVPMLALWNNSWSLLSYPLYGFYGNELLQGNKIAMFVYWGLILFATVCVWKGRNRLWN